MWNNLLFKIWSLVTVSTSYDDNHYTTTVSNYISEIDKFPHKDRDK